MDLVSNLKHHPTQVLDAVGRPTMPLNYTRNCRYCQVPALSGLLVRAGDAAALDPSLTWVRLLGRQMWKPEASI
jgi:hypothetical protein